MEREKFIRILDQQLVPALGCTDPVGVAYGAACARSYISGKILSIEAELSVNIIKNASAVCIPRTEGRCGVGLALALGALGGNFFKGLEVLADLKPEHIGQAEEMLEEQRVSVRVADTEQTLYIRVILRTEEGQAEVVIEDSYLNVTSVRVNGSLVLVSGAACEEDQGKEAEVDYEILSLSSILEFVSQADEEQLTRVGQAIDMNLAVSQAGQEKDYGMVSGRSIQRKMSEGFLSGDWINQALVKTMAAVDTRMAGADLPVMSNTGSGNQGLACTLPVICVANFWNKSRLEMMRAVAISCLTAVHIKEKLGVLSAVCGAVIAGAGTACGVVYLMGGDDGCMVRAMKTVLGDVSGMMCDGAKAGCAMKVATCTHAALLAAVLAMEGKGIEATDGIVGEEEQQMIDNFIQVSKDGMADMDRVVLDIILKK